MGKEKSKWRSYGAGGAVIAIFIVLLLFRLNVPQKFFITGEKQPIVIDGGTAGEAWMAITQNNKKIGYAVRRRVQTEQGSKFFEDIFVWINAMGVVQPLVIRTAAELKTGGEISGFRFTLESNLFRFAARGNVENGKMIIRSDGDSKPRVFPITAPLYWGNFVVASAGRGVFEPGQKKSFALFDPASLSIRELKVNSLGEERLTVLGKMTSARKLSLDFMGMKQIAWVSSDGLVLREEGILGIVLQVVSKKEALAGLEAVSDSDLTAAAAIPVTRLIDDPAGLKTLTVRINNLPQGNFLLEGGRQTFRNGLLTVKSEKYTGSSAPLLGVSENLELLRRAAPFIESDNPKIRQKAAEILMTSDDDMTKAQKLVVWMHANIAKRPVISVPDALQTLENMVGDCNEHAVLLAALGRAAGLPTEIETGLVYMRGKFFFHAWNTFYIKKIGGWITADAALGQLPADVTHLRFTRGSLERQVDMTALIGRLTLDFIGAEK